ncbi:hypothetical protein CLIM01_14481 [Colletotrichum limetticola]|uniref:Uncharacterized protein n=1 Tax=Colletotrichum limetticola TaxID=1209924 RepID=A0ABQ9PCL0_9PEZI|nr:hypothetical protein CLIM01_14481 [Colletotrichum limetticola]
MAVTVSVYNNLPTLEEADQRFVDRSRVLRDLKDLLAKYDNVYGLCLVHAHCQLNEGEIMLAQGNTTQPESIDSMENCHPERWLPSGKPYEFTTRETVPPPADLLKSFNELTYGIDVLGLYHVDDKNTGKMIEHTVGRKNILSSFDDPNALQPGDYIETAWDLGKGDPVTMTCVIYCDTRSTRSGGTHKGTKSHVKQ